MWDAFILIVDTVEKINKYNLFIIKNVVVNYNSKSRNNLKNC